MKLRRRPLISCLALFALIHGITALSDPLSEKDATARRIASPGPEVQRDSILRTSTKTGTKDAPVDGHDGKPHSGPFVGSVTEPEEKKSPLESKSSTKDQALPDDGVMNDLNRATPKKGTTGTEGGVSEKTNDQMAQESESGRKKLKKPEPPKDANAVAHTEESQRADELEALKKQDGTDKSSMTDRNRADKEDKPRGAAGISKPDSLEKSKPASTKVKEELNTYSTSKSSTDDQDSDDEDEDDGEIEGAHDLIRWDSLFGSFSSIAATEIGDKTFIVAALMAMRHPKAQVFTAAFSALFVMTILSGIAGHAVGTVISKRYAALVAAMLFLVFGIKSLREGAMMPADQGAGEEIREVQAELEEKEIDMARQANHRDRSHISPYELESGRASRSHSRGRIPSIGRSPSTSPSPSRARTTIKSRVAGIKNLLGLLLSPAWVETFSMTFVGELGDRSQIATVAMAAGQEYWWVMIGATLGHFVCTAVAVLGGSALAGRVSMRKGIFRPCLMSL